MCSSKQVISKATPPASAGVAHQPPVHPKKKVKKAPRNKITSEEPQHFMSQATVASISSAGQSAMSNLPNAPPSGAAPPPPGEEPDLSDESDEDEDLLTSNRTFDKDWFDRRSLMAKDGFTAVYDAVLKKKVKKMKVKSTIPTILRDMGPPEGSIFDPRTVWDAEKEKRKLAAEAAAAAAEVSDPGAPKPVDPSLSKSQAAAARKAEKDKAKAKKNEPKLSKAEQIKLANAEKQAKKSHGKDVEKMSNNNSLEALQNTKVDTDTGKLQRMLKMLHLAVHHLTRGDKNASEEEVFDILFALEEMKIFKDAEEELEKEKKGKSSKSDSKAAKDEDDDDDDVDDLKEKVEKYEKKVKKAKKKGDSTAEDEAKSKLEKYQKKLVKAEAKKAEASKAKSTSKKSKKDANDGDGPIQLSENAKILKMLFSENDYKTSIKHARKLLDSHKSEIVKYQMTRMSDRLPPLSVYNRKFKLEEWQCNVLGAIDRGESAIVCAPTSSGKTLLSTYTCTKVRTLGSDTKGMVLFVLPTEVLVWQVAATYYQFFKGNVSICTDLIQFQDREAQAQVYIGTPRALEVALTKARGVAGQEMVKGAREFFVLDGGFKFDYMVLDEVHSLNGPEGDALQRIIRATRCPMLALSATIGNAQQLKGWFQQIRVEHAEHIKLYEMPEGATVDPNDVSGLTDTKIGLTEHFARFINLQRYVVKENDKGQAQMIKLHPIAAMTRERIEGQPELVDSLSMTPTDCMDLYKKLKDMFPDQMEERDDPENFFFGGDNASSLKPIDKRITLPQTKEYESHLKTKLTRIAAEFPDKYDKLKNSVANVDVTTLKSINSLEITDQLYSVIDNLHKKELLPAVAFQLSTIGAFKMFTTLLRSLELAQNEAYPNWRKELEEKALVKAQLRNVAAGKADKNEKDAQEDAQAGLEDQEDLSAEDIFQPHPKFVLSPKNAALTTREIDTICELLDKAKEGLDKNHALIRGLRRGIAVYTNEVGFSCYRRQVQILAQKGKLAVVFSDEALAYGVNMPFRSCVFCGDMGDALTPLIAQQMQGRAGRRGMDVQGNVVYLGLNWQRIENLMLGQISQVTGKDPHYPLIALQGVIAASNDPDDFTFEHRDYKECKGDYARLDDDERHELFCSRTEKFVHKTKTGLNWELTRFGKALSRSAPRQMRVPTVDEFASEQMMSRTLENFCHDEEGNDYATISRDIIEGLGYVDENMVLQMDHNVMSCTWELSVKYLPEAVNLTACIDTLHRIFVADQRRSYDKEGDQNAFVSCIIRIIDRVPCPEGTTPIKYVLKADVEQGSSKIVDETSKNMYFAIEQALCQAQMTIDNLPVPQSEKDKMYIPLKPLDYSSSPYGPDLDSGLLEVMTTKRKGFADDVPITRRNELKNRLFKYGDILKFMHNNLQQPHGKHKGLADYCRKCFTAVDYVLKDITNQMSDTPDECDI